MPQTWTISAGGRIYGPYCYDQLQSFAAEGRFAAHSLVAGPGEDTFRPASEHSALAALFAPVRPAPQAPDAPSFGRDGETLAGETSRYVIVSDMRSGSISALEEAIFGLGSAYRFMPQAWVLTSTVSLNTIRHALVQKLGKLDSLFLTDTMRDRAAWFNFGPEADARVRRLWQRKPDARAKPDRAA